MNAPIDHTQLERAAIDGAVHLPLALCAPSPTNPRKRFDPAQLTELAASIKKHQVIQPILVRPWPNAKAGQPLYEIVAGERRWRASGQAELTHIPAIVRDMSDFEVLELQLVENLQRKDLHPLEEAEGYRRLLRKPDGLQGYANADELAEKIGKSRSYVFQRLKLLDLAGPGREAFADERISFSVALLIARLPNADDQAKATEAILTGWGGEPMSYRTASEYLQREFMLALDRAIFKITDASLVPAAGSCRDCQKRTGANPDLFDDVKKADTCTDAACFHQKEEAHRTRLKEAAEAKGMEVITGKEAKAAKPTSYGGMKGYLELDKPHYAIDSGKPLRKLLGKHTLPVKLLEDPHSGDLVEVVPEAEALKALKEAGKLTRAVMPTTSASQRQAEAKAKAEKAWRAEAAREVVEAAGGDRGRLPEVRSELLVEAALLLWHRMESDHCDRVQRLMGWAPIPGSSYDPSHRKAVDARIRGLSSDQFAQYLAAAVVGRDMHANAYTADGKPERLLRVAELLQVDVAAVKQRLKNEAAQRVPKAAAKKPAKPAATPETALAAALKDAKPARPAKPAKKASTTVKPSKVLIKYRDPATGNTWTGRGLQPAWLKAELAKGRALSEFDIATDQATKATPAAGAHLSAAAADPFRT